MRMLITVEFADAGTKSGAHRILTIGRGLEEMQSGNIGLSLEEAKSPVSAVQDEFVAAQAAEILETHRQCPRCPKRLKIKDWKLRRVNTALGKVFLPAPPSCHVLVRRRQLPRHIASQGLGFRGRLTS